MSEDWYNLVGCCRLSQRDIINSVHYTMKVNNTVLLPDSQLVDFLTDGVTVKMIGSRPHADIITLDPESLGLVSRFPVDTVVHDFYSSCIDDDCIYLPTKLGQILALDKFSSDILATINLGMPIMSDLVQDDKNIYCICGVPLSRKWEVVFTNFCVCICDKETGDKKVQTSYFEGDPFALVKNGDSIWVIGGEYLIQYSCSGEYLRKVRLGPNFEYPPLMTETHILCVSTEGIVRALDKDKLELATLTRAQPCISKPFLIDENLAWITPSGICYVDFKEKGFRGIEANKKLLTDSVLSPDKTKLFAFDDAGSIVSFDLDNHTIRSIRLTQETILRKPVISENYLLVASATQLHQLEVE